MHKNIKDLTGKTFNYLTVLKLAQTKPVLWLCRCECGVEKFIDTSNLVRGSTKSCGCMKAQLVSRATSTHRESGTAEYRTWVSMRSRCKYPSVNGYKNYGGRGITVSPEWMHDYPQFLKDMGRKPSKEYSIERKDTDGNYERDNCFWATPREQNRNKRMNRVLEFNGESMIITDWAEKIGVSVQTLSQRLTRGDSLEKALTTPLNGNKLSKIEIDGDIKTIDEWCDLFGVTRKTIYNRRCAGTLKELKLKLE